MFKTVADSATTIAATTTVWAWINDNSGAIMAVVSVLSLMIAAVFYWLNYNDNKRKTNARIAAIMLEALREAKSRGVDNTGEVLRLIKKINTEL